MVSLCSLACIVVVIVVVMVDEMDGVLEGAVVEGSACLLVCVLSRFFKR